MELAGKGLQSETLEITTENTRHAPDPLRPAPSVDDSHRDSLGAGRAGLFAVRQQHADLLAVRRLAAPGRQRRHGDPRHTQPRHRHGKPAHRRDQRGRFAAQAPEHLGNFFHADTDAAPAGLRVQEGAAVRALLRLGHGAHGHDPHRPQPAHTGLQQGGRAGPPADEPGRLGHHVPGGHADSARKKGRLQDRWHAAGH